MKTIPIPLSVPATIAIWIHVHSMRSRTEQITRNITPTLCNRDCVCMCVIMLPWLLSCLITKSDFFFVKFIHLQNLLVVSLHCILTISDYHRQSDCQCFCSNSVCSYTPGFPVCLEWLATRVDFLTPHINNP